MRFVTLALLGLFTFSAASSFAQPAIEYDDAFQLLTPEKIRNLLEKTQIAVKSKNKKVIKNFFEDHGEKSFKLELNINPEVVERLGVAKKYTLSAKNIEGLNVFHAFFGGTFKEDKQVIARDNRSAAGRFIVNSPLYNQGQQYYFVSLNCGYQLKYDKEYTPRFFNLQCRASGEDPTINQSIEEDS